MPRRRARGIEELAAETVDGGPGVLVGTIWAEDGKLYNAVALLDGGRVEAVRYKVDLPNYGVFDEKRVFDAGPCRGRSTSAACASALPICEDIWKDEVVRVPAGDGRGDAARRPTARRSTGPSPTSA